MEHAQRKGTPTAFTGLGFDLSGTAAVTRLLTLRKIEPASAPREIPEQSPAGAWGFDLMLLLNRETGGS